MQVVLPVATYSLTAFFLAVVFGFVFVALVSPFGRATLQDRSNADLFPAVGVAIATTLLVIGAQLGIAIRFAFLFLLLASIFGAVSTIRLPVRSTCAWLIQPFVACVIATLHYWTVFNRFSLGWRPTVFSNANNDLALYILGGDNFRMSGFSEAWRVSGYTVGSTTKFDAAGSSALIAVGSWITRLPVWRIAVPVMILLTALTLQLLVVLVNRLVGKRTWSAWLVATWAIFSDFGARSQSNFFLNQTLSRLFMVMSILLLVDIFRSETRRGFTILSLACTFAAALSCYASGAVVLFVCFVSISLVLSIHKLFTLRWSITDLLNIYGAILLALLLGAAASTPRLSVAVEHIRFYSRSNITGWLAPTSDWKELVSVDHANQKLVWFGFMALIIMIVLGWWHVAKKREPCGILLVPAFSLTVTIGIFVAARWRYGSSTYQSWKMLVSLQPLIIVFFGALIVGVLVRAQKLRVFVSLLLLSIVGINLQNSQRTWLDVVQVPDPATSNILSNQDRKEITPLSIVLNPYLETMIAPVLADVHFASYGTDTYIGGPSPLTTCVLTRASPSTNLEDVFLRSGSVVLIQNPNCISDSSG